MKRILLALMLLALLAGSAQASLDYNSFLDDRHHAGRFMNLAFDGEYVYWLHTPDDGLDWLKKSANLYRMRPGEGEAELILHGRDDFWMQDVHCIGNRLLISAADTTSGQTHPAVMNLDGSGYAALPGNIGSVVIYAGTIINSVDGAIYEIDADSLKPRKFYNYPVELAGDNPILTQRVGMDLFFVTNSFDWYRLDLLQMKLTKICTLRGDGFVHNYKLYISDYDNGGTYRYGMDGSREKISDHTYMFLQGSGDYVLAKLLDPAGFGSAQGGRIFDMTWMWDDLESALIGTCEPYMDFLLDGKLFSRDAQNNRITYCTEPVAQLIAE